VTTADWSTTTFGCMGCSMAVSTGDDEAARVARGMLERFDAVLSRFHPGSELSRLNADPRATVPASQVLRMAIRAALWAAEHSGGLVDPTLLGALERAGYGTSLEGAQPASLHAALARAPRRRPGRPSPRAPWRAVTVDDAAGTITRPPGLRLDTGGSTKGLAADGAAHVLGAGFIVDCAGDIRVDAAGPLRIGVEHPLTGEVAHTLHLAQGAVATSGIGRRVWQRPDREFAHHLLDPATGRPAWTGLLQVTAVAPSALEAETVAKTALLGGPARGRALLAGRHGGVLVHDDGAVESVVAGVCDQVVAA
jgi:thiamine biosynthesis lipoprotein